MEEESEKTSEPGCGCCCKDDATLRKVYDTIREEAVGTLKGLGVLLQRWGASWRAKKVEGGWVTFGTEREQTG